MAPKRPHEASSSSNPTSKRKSRFTDKKSSISTTAASRAVVETNAASLFHTESLKVSIKEQMAHMQSMIKSNIPTPLLLDDMGRTIDGEGKLVISTIESIATLKANKSEKKSQVKNPYLQHYAKEEWMNNMDPRLKIKKREIRGAKGLAFIQQGTYVKQGEMMRSRDELKGATVKSGYLSGRNPNTRDPKGITDIIDDSTTVLSATTILPLRIRDPIPDVEWWDMDYLPKELQKGIDKFGFIKPSLRKENPNITITVDMFHLKHCGTASLVEHTPRIKSILPDMNAKVIMPLMLTKAEQKRLRRQNRSDREKEKQDKIALGLIPPPEPKVKLSNMMRVLQEQAVADPSAVEKKVREQMAQRIQNHEMRNQARKLTPQERREKNKTKLKEDATGLIQVAVFRVNNLNNLKHRFKVDVNAQQWMLTGGVLICKEEPVNLVVVEGGKKAIKGYIKLMTKRIDWNGDLDAIPEEEKEKKREEYSNGTNACALVWQGMIAKRSFNSFRFQDCRTASTARKVLEAKNVAHYWDMVYNYQGASAS